MLILIFGYNKNKNLQKMENLKTQMYYLESVKKYLIVKTCELVGLQKNTRILNLNDIQSVDEMEDSWFLSLSDEDFGTVQNAINNRI